MYIQTMVRDLSFAAVRYLFSQTASVVTKKFLGETWKYLAQLPVPGRTKLHFVELKSKISQMPFIYKDLESEVLTDFVEIDVTALDKNLVRRPRQPFELSYEKRFRNRKHVVLFGRGGIGKTTYLRRMILDVVSPKVRSSLFDEGEKSVPFYVPLKAIENSEELPILKYLLANNGYLSGRGGIRRLSRLAREHRLMLCLDGYDEIPFPDSDPAKSFVLRELALLTGVRRSRSPVLPSKEHESFYRDMEYCRLWISSRLEFYQQYPFEIERTALAAEITGVSAGNRAKLVKNIFARYEARLKTANLQVSHEGFIQRIERSGRDELVNLSYSPLFLTVMAYVYVTRVIEKRNYDVGLATNVIELIRECVKLLLLDLDEGRARGLSVADRQALLCRRNEWSTEKRAFLGYFALQLLLDSRPTFTSEYIRTHSLSFFGGRSATTETELILRSMTTKSTLPNFVEQLILCGIFVQVEKSEHGLLFDFPHRRFREILAAEYICTLANYISILEQFVERRELQEALYVFFEATPYQKEIITLLCNKSIGATDRRFGAVLGNCLDRTTAESNHSDIMWDFILDCLQNHISFKLDRRVLAHMKDRPEGLVKLLSALNEGLNSIDCFKTALSCELIRLRYGARALTDALESKLTRLEANQDLFRVIIHHFLLANGTLSDGMLDRIASNKERVLDVGVALALTDGSQRAPGHIDIIGRLISLPDKKLVVQFLRVMVERRPNIISLLCEREILPRSLEAMAWLCHLGQEKLKRESVYVVTRSAIEMASPRPTDNPKESVGIRNPLWRYRGTVFYSPMEFLGASEPESEQSEGNKSDKPQTGEHSGIPKAVRAALIEASRLESGICDRIRTAIEGIEYNGPEFPVFFD